MAIYSISLTDDEERKLKFYAEAVGLSVSTYIKYVVTANTKMIMALHEVINKINELKLNDSFRIKELIPETWKKLDQSERRSLGIALNNLVINKKLSYLTVRKDTNGDIYKISFPAQIVKFEMQESTKDEIKKILNNSDKYLALKSYSTELSSFCNKIREVIDKAVGEQQDFMDKKCAEALNYCGNYGIDPKQLSELDKFLSIELDAEATYLIDKLIDLQAKCISNLFS